MDEQTPFRRYGHIHLMFEDPAFLTPCFVDPGDGLGVGFGRGTGASCIAANWQREPRFAAGHAPDHVLRVGVEDRVTHAPRLFDVASIRILGPVMAAMIFNSPPQFGQCLRSISSTRLSNLAQLIRVGR